MTAPTPLVVVGTGGHGRETFELVSAINRATPTFALLGFLDDDPDANRDRVRALRTEVLGPVSLLEGMDARYVLGVGSGEARRRLDERITAWGGEAAVLVHPEATVGAEVTLGPGAVVAAGGRVTTNVVLGRHSHLNVNASVSHDCRVGPYSTVSPGATVSGTVSLGEGVLIGAGATVIQGISVGGWSTVGAGAVVVRDVPPGVTAVGVPARW